MGEQIEDRDRVEKSLCRIDVVRAGLADFVVVVDHQFHQGLCGVTSIGVQNGFFLDSNRQGPRPEIYALLVTKYVRVGRATNYQPAN